MKKQNLCYNEEVMEGNKKIRPRALLVFGAPCSGKTTFAEKFAKKFGLAYYDFNKLMEEHHFSREDVMVILGLLAQTRQTLVIEGAIDTEKDRIEMRNLLRSYNYDPALAWLQTDVSTIRSRMKARYRSVSKARQIYDKAVSEIEAPAENEHPIILSGKHTFETQTKHVIAGLADL